MDEKDYRELSVHVQEIDSRTKSNEHRLNEHDMIMKELQKKQDTIYDLTASVKSIATDMNYIKEDVKEVKTGQQKLNDKVQELENKPNKMLSERMQGITDKVIWTVIGGILAYLLHLMTGINF